MLVITRKANEEIVIGGPATITVVVCHRGRVRLGIKADREVKILRGELVKKDQNAPSAPGGLDAS